MPLKGTYAPSTAAWARKQAERYEASEGAEAGTLRGRPVIVLTSVGARTACSARPHSCASSTTGGTRSWLRSGAPRHPVWYHNLKADPHVELQHGPTRRDYTAREVTGDERAVWWAARSRRGRTTTATRQTRERSPSSCSNRSTDRRVMARSAAGRRQMLVEPRVGRDDVVDQVLELAVGQRPTDLCLDPLAGQSERLGLRDAEASGRRTPLISPSRIMSRTDPAIGRGPMRPPGSRAGHPWADRTLGWSQGCRAGQCEAYSEVTNRRSGRDRGSSPWAGARLAGDRDGGLKRGSRPCVRVAGGVPRGHARCAPATGRSRLAAVQRR